MDMVLVKSLRKYGWPDTEGQIQIGNAAILCFLRYCETMRISDISSEQIERGRRICRTLLNKA